MSEGRRICVCGKERKKGPVVITITTCKHNNPPIIEGANVCMSGMTPPLATSSPIDSQTDPKSGNQRKDTDSGLYRGTKEQSPDAKSISNGRPIEIIGSSHPEGSLGKTSLSVGESMRKADGSIKIDDTAYKTALDETALESTVDETAFESALNETTFESALGETAFESALGETAFESALGETAFESALDETVQGNTTDSTVDDTAVIDSHINETTNDTTEVTESDNNDTTEVTRNETNVSENTGNETTGVTDASVVSENGTINESEYHTAEESLNTTEDVANDDTGGPMVIMLAETAVNTLPFLENLFWPKYSSKSMSTSSDDQEKCTIELIMFEKHSKNCRQNLKNRRENLFFDGTAFLQSIGRMSYPTCSDDAQKKKESGESNTVKGYKSDSEKSLDRCKKIFQSFERHIQNEQFYNNDKSLTQLDIIQDKETKDRAVQFENVYIRAPKWYDGFLICFGLKPDEDMYYIGDDNNVLSDNSSSLVTKYLRI